MAALGDERPNEFTDSPIDGRLRPYNNGVRQHHESIATILVYKEADQNTTEGLDIDYLKRLEGNVKNLTQATQENPNKSVISSLSPVTSDGSITRESLDGKNEYYGVFNNFSLTQVSESNEQIVKLHVNFGSDWNAFFFGEQPRIYQFSGIFLDTKDYPYYQEFMVAYDKYLSGRKSIESKVRTKFIYDGKIVDGYMLNITTNQTASDNIIKQFQFTILVRGFYWIRKNLIPTITSNSNRITFKEEFNGLSNARRLTKPSDGNLYGISLNNTQPSDPLREEFA